LYLWFVVYDSPTISFLLQMITKRSLSTLMRTYIEQLRNAINKMLSKDPSLKSIVSQTIERGLFHPTLRGDCWGQTMAT
jgi:hypothetical protein